MKKYKSKNILSTYIVFHFQSALVWFATFSIFVLYELFTINIKLKIHYVLIKRLTLHFSKFSQDLRFIKTRYLANAEINHEKSRIRLIKEISVYRASFMTQSRRSGRDISA
jgi:hypothetical protein